MSIKVMTLIWEHAPASGNELLLLLAIADNANDLGTDAWPSIDTLARRTRLNPRTVQRLLHRLSDRGLLQVETGGGRKRNRYAIALDRLTGNPLAKTDLPLAARLPRHADTPDSSAASEVVQLRRPSDGTAAPPVTSSPVQSPTSGASEADAVLAGLRHRWKLTEADQRRLRPALAAALTAGHDQADLVRLLGSNTGGARSAFAVITARLRELPAHARESPEEWPEWCQQCDGPEPHRRIVFLNEDLVAWCPICNPKHRRPTRSST